MGGHIMVFLSCKEIKRVPWAGSAVLAAARPVPEVWWVREPGERRLRALCRGTRRWLPGRAQSHSSAFTSSAL